MGDTQTAMLELDQEALNEKRRRRLLDHHAANLVYASLATWQEPAPERRLPSSRNGNERPHQTSGRCRGSSSSCSSVRYGFPLPIPIPDPVEAGMLAKIAALLEAIQQFRMRVQARAPGADQRPRETLRVSDTPSQPDPRDGDQVTDIRGELQRCLRLREHPAYRSAAGSALEAQPAVPLGSRASGGRTRGPGRPDPGGQRLHRDDDSQHGLGAGREDEHQLVKAHKDLFD